MRPAGPALELRREAQAQLVDAARVEQRAEQRRPALAQHAGQAPVGEGGEHRVGGGAGVTADVDHLGPRTGEGAAHGVGRGVRTRGR